MMKRPNIVESSITLEDLRFYAYHGVLPDERRDGADYRLSVTLRFPAGRAMQSDAVEDTINYAEVYRLISDEMAIPSDLLEHVVYRILCRLGEHFASLTGATCSLTKVQPPIPVFDGKGATFTATATYQEE